MTKPKRFANLLIIAIQVEWIGFHPQQTELYIRTQRLALWDPKPFRLVLNTQAHLIYPKSYRSRNCQTSCMCANINADVKAVKHVCRTVQCTNKSRTYANKNYYFDAKTKEKKDSSYGAVVRKRGFTEHCTAHKVFYTGLVLCTLNRRVTWVCGEDITLPNMCGSFTAIAQHSLRVTHE